MLAQGRLDLAQLNAEAPQLDLLIAPTLENQATILVAHHQVTGAIEAGAGTPAERIGHEALGGQFRTLQIPARQPVSSKYEFTEHTNRNRAQALIYHVAGRVCQRIPNGDGVRLRRNLLNEIPGCESSAFRWSIPIEQAFWGSVL